METSSELDRLHDVGWQSLGAPEVPGLIAGLASPDAALRRRACDEIFPALWAPSGPAPAAAAAAPFLIDLVRQPATKNRGRIALLLGMIAESDENEPAGAARAAVRAGLPVFLELLAEGDTDQPLGHALFYLVAQFCEDKEAIRERLARLAQDAVSVVVPKADGFWTLNEATDVQRLDTALGRQRGTTVWESVGPLAYMGARAEHATSSIE
jgi:hypothetical protein